MAPRRTRLAVAILVASCSIVLPPQGAAAQETLAHAKELYASAAYDEALAILNLSTLAADLLEIDQYRALCLLALGRGDEARGVIQRIVERSPSFEPSAATVSPRMRETFQAVRRRVLPSVVRQMYENAKTALEGGDLPAAKAGFESVTTYLDALEALGSSELADLRVLSKGFLDLVSSMSKAAAPPEPVAAVPVREAVPPPAAMIHQAGEPGITPPVAISQAMPPWRPRRIENQTYDGVMTILIDENGLVTEVFVVKTSRPAYDTALRRAAAAWRFQPATVNGVPVKYRKVIAIRLTGEGDSR